MNVVTWLAILVLGPGSVIVFVLFLRDVGKVLKGPERHDERSSRP